MLRYDRASMIFPSSPPSSGHLLPASSSCHPVSASTIHHVRDIPKKIEHFRWNSGMSLVLHLSLRALFCDGNLSPTGSSVARDRPLSDYHSRRYVSYGNCAEPDVWTSVSSLLIHLGRFGKHLMK